MSRVGPAEARRLSGAWGALASAHHGSLAGEAAREARRVAGIRETTPPPDPEDRGAVSRGAGDGLLSRALSGGVPSALQGLTTVFGMGTGVAPALQSPAIFKVTLDCSSDRVTFESTVRSLGFLLVGSR